MQIFVRHPIHQKTLVFDCSFETKLSDLVEWIEINTFIPSYMFYLRHLGKPLTFQNNDQLQKTFKELNIIQEDTIHVATRSIHH